MSARFRRSLAGFLTGLFALAIFVAPTAHARAVIGKALFVAPTAHARAVIGKALFVAAYAMPDGTLPHICGHSEPEDHGQHRFAAACLACVIMAAPGLPNAPLAIVGRVMPAGVAPVWRERDVEVRQLAWAR
jgi:hypothetical protein